MKTAELHPGMEVTHIREKGGLGLDANAPYAKPVTVVGHWPDMRTAKGVICDGSSFYGSYYLNGDRIYNTRGRGIVVRQESGSLTVMRPGQLYDMNHDGLEQWKASVSANQQALRERRVADEARQMRNTHTINQALAARLGNGHHVTNAYARGDNLAISPADLARLLDVELEAGE
jgi:hypothetical protein